MTDARYPSCESQEGARGNPSAGAPVAEEEPRAPSCNSPELAALRTMFKNADESREDPEPDPCCGNCHKAVDVPLYEDWDPSKFCLACAQLVADHARSLLRVVDELAEDQDEWVQLFEAEQDRRETAEVKLVEAEKDYEWSRKELYAQAVALDKKAKTVEAELATALALVSELNDACVHYEKDIAEARDIVRYTRGLIEPERYPSMTTLARDAVTRWDREVPPASLRDAPTKKEPQ